MSGYTNNKFEADPEYYEKKFCEEDPQELAKEFQREYIPSGLLHTYMEHYNGYKASKWIGEGNETKRLGREPNDDERRKAMLKAIDKSRKLRHIEEFLQQKTATTSEFNKWNKTHTEKQMVVDKSIVDILSGISKKKKATKKTKYEKHMEQLEKQEQQEEESLKVTIKTDKPKKVSETDKKKEETKPKKD